jgi:hypothetical protein
MAGVKITDLVTITEAASDDLLYIVDVSDTTSGPEGTSKAIEVGDLRGYKVYTALLTQADEDAPTAIELENTIGEITFSYANIGQYYIISDDLFTTNKTFAIIGIPSEGVSNGNFSSVVYLNNNTLFINSSVLTEGVMLDTNGILFNTSIEIRVYN